jgi:hypothetical protein
MEKQERDRKSMPNGKWHFRAPQMAAHFLR